MRPGFALLSLCVALALPACTKVTDEPPPEPAPAASADAAGITEQDELVGRGEAIAEVACADCHAIGAEGESPHAEAPPFRLLHRTVEIGALKDAFAAGRVTDHPDMPDWVFEPVDIDGLIAYLETVQARSPE
jgi:mono/diheme cytochrome c family protein